MAQSLAAFDTALKSGATTKLKKSVADTGCSDAGTKEILSLLSSLGIKLRRGSGRSHRNETLVQEQLEEELREWLKGYPKEARINPLLGISGASLVDYSQRSF